MSKPTTAEWLLCVDDQPDPYWDDDAEILDDSCPHCGCDLSVLHDVSRCGSHQEFLDRLQTMHEEVSDDDFDDEYAYQHYYGF